MDDASQHEPDDALGVRPPRPGEIELPGGLVASEPLVGTGASTPLEEDEPEGTIPPCPLWAMKQRRHIQWHLLPSHDRHERIREVVGTGDDTVYVIDDGRHHVMFGRRVGAAQGEVEYGLVGRAELAVYDELRQGTSSAAKAFAAAHELVLCGVAVEQDIRSSNVFDVERYESFDEVPTEYRPGAAFVNLAEDLDPA